MYKRNPRITGIGKTLTGSSVPSNGADRWEAVNACSDASEVGAPVQGTRIAIFFRNCAVGNSKLRSWPVSEEVLSVNAASVHETTHMIES